MFGFYSYRSTHTEVLSSIDSTHREVLSSIDSTHTEVLSSIDSKYTEVLSSIDEVKYLIKGLHRNDSAISLRSVALFAPSVRTKAAMKQLCKHLYKFGVKADMIRGREGHAVAFFQYLNTARLNAPPIVNQEVPQTEFETTQTAEPVVDSEELLEQQQNEESGTRTLNLGKPALLDPKAYT